MGFRRKSTQGRKTARLRSTHTIAPPGLDSVQSSSPVTLSSRETIPQGFRAAKLFRPSTLYYIHPTCFSGSRYLERDGARLRSIRTRYGRVEWLEKLDLRIGVASPFCLSSIWSVVSSQLFLLPLFFHRHTQPTSSSITYEIYPQRVSHLSPRSYWLHRRLGAARPARLHGRCRIQRFDRRRVGSKSFQFVLFSFRRFSSRFRQRSWRVGSQLNNRKCHRVRRFCSKSIAGTSRLAKRSVRLDFTVILCIATHHPHRWS